jgi:hypothetical protein
VWTLERALAWLRAGQAELAAVPMPGRGHTLERWRWLWSVARQSPALARLAEGHLDALAILAELDHRAAPGL